MTAYEFICKATPGFLMGRDAIENLPHYSVKMDGTEFDGAEAGKFLVYVKDENDEIYIGETLNAKGLKELKARLS